MGNGCHCTQQTNEKNLFLQIDTQKDITSEASHFRDSKTDTSLNIPLVSVAPSSKEAPNPHLVVTRKRPKTSMPRNSTFLNRTSINVSVTGPKEVGKTSFVKRFCLDKFDLTYKPTKKDELLMKRCPFNNRFYDFRLNVLHNAEDDTDYSHNDFVILLFDSSNPGTLEYAKKFFEEKLKRSVRLHDNGLSNLLLVATKTDIEPMSPKRIEDISKYCFENKMNFFQSSAKDNKGIDSIIQTLIGAFDGDVFKFNG